MGGQGPVSQREAKALRLCEGGEPQRTRGHSQGSRMELRNSESSDRRDRIRALVGKIEKNS